jgi:nucleoside-diphosphate-sugar epimerase
MTVGGQGPIAAITGANGYVGSIVADSLSAEGFQIRRLVRRPELDTNDRSYDIVEGCSPEALREVDVLVHCAYDFSATKRSDVWDRNVYGTRRLLDEAVSHSVRRTIIVSSMSAYAGTRQIYGRAKLASETDAYARGMCAIRPGLIYGPGWGGMGGTLRKLTRLPIVPLVGRHSHQFTLHEDDLRTAVAALATADAVPSVPLGLANPEPVPFSSLLRGIARADADRNPRFLPLPWSPLYWAIRVAEAASVGLPIRADSLLGLVRPAPSVPNLGDMEKLGVSFRPFSL